MDNPVTQRILELLTASGRPFERVDHALTQTAEQAAAARGTSLRIGGKSLVMKMGKKANFGVFVVSGARRLDNRKVRRVLGVSKLRFATVDELMALTGLRPGCVPPFGSPVFDMPLFLDAATAALPALAFTLADHSKSAVMNMTDYLDVAAPHHIADLSSTPEPRSS